MIRHFVFGEDSNSKFELAILVNDNCFNKQDVLRYYVTPLIKEGYDINKIVCVNLPGYQKRLKAKDGKEYLSSLMPKLKALDVKTILITDGDYTKFLCKVKAPTRNTGYILKNELTKDDFAIFFTINFRVLIYDDAKEKDLHIGLKHLSGYLRGSYVEPGKGILHSAYYPETLQEIENTLKKLQDYPMLACDVETKSLKTHEAGISTISFAWSQHEGVAIPIDRYGTFTETVLLRKLLKKFFETYKGILIFHNANYDVKILIFYLFMEDYSDYQGLLNGLNIFKDRIHDTKIITYLAKNSCTRISLKLKDNAQEFAGNYGLEDIDDTSKIELPDLLEYNLIDSICTFYLFNMYYPKMVSDDQLSIYNEIFLPSVDLICNMELVGIPLNKETIDNNIKELNQKIEILKKKLSENKLIKEFTWEEQRQAYITKNLLLKKKFIPIEEFAVEFNNNSTVQIQKLLHESWQLPVIDLTDKKQPSVGADTIKKHINYLKNEPTTVKNLEKIGILEILVELAKLEILVSTFLKRFQEDAVLKPDGHYYLHGNFNLGGTPSGRLSSSNPNLQNIPNTGNEYAKKVKECIEAPEGWIFVGADFSSLEDRISALTTKDPAKLKVYTDGYDGHCLRAFSYFGSQMPDIQNTVESINSIEDKYPHLRQESKSPTFALTYQGTYHTLMKNLGFSEEKAKSIEAKYHELYEVSDKWVQDQLEQATIDGFVTLAFGLRLRTPLLGNSILGNSKTPYQTIAEGRTAGNALGQSYGMLNNRAGIELKQRLMASPHVLDIRPCLHVHDSQYFLVRDDIKPIKWLNDNLIECMQWQNLKAIEHDEVKLGGSLEIYHPNWTKKISIKNNSSEQEIISTIKSALED